MNQIERAAEVVDRLRALGRESALVGGLAVSLRARQRYTKDIDVAVSVAADAEAERLVFDMQRAGFRILQTVDQEAKGLLATARFLDPKSTSNDPSLDILCASRRRSSLRRRW